MSQTQQKVVPLPNIPSEDSPAVEPKVGSWEPYLTLMKSWQRADEICANAIDRAETTRKEEELRAHSTFKTDKTNVEVKGKERLVALEAERKSTRESADRLLAQVNTIQKRVRQDMATIGLESLMDGIDVPASSERGDAAITLPSLQNIAERATTIEKSLQDELFALRSERQRQSAQMWAVGTGLWLVAVLLFAPSPLISAVLVAIGVFVIGTPRKIGQNEAVRPSFASHAGHCISLLRGKKQVMQYPFSLVGKDRDMSGKTVSGATVTAFFSWIAFIAMEPSLSYNPFEILKHLCLVSGLCAVAGTIMFIIANQDITSIQLDEGDKNKILR